MYTHTHTYIHTYIYILINIKNSGKPETVHRYGPVSEIYHTASQTDTTSNTVLTPLTVTLIEETKRTHILFFFFFFMGKIEKFVLHL